MTATPNTLSTKADLDAAEKLCDEASSGPWRIAVANEDHGWWGASVAECVIVGPIEGAFAIGATCDDNLPTEDNYRNAQFIAHSRTLVPELIAALREVATWYAEDVFRNVRRTYDPVLVEERLAQVRAMLNE